MGSIVSAEKFLLILTSSRLILGAGFCYSIITNQSPYLGTMWLIIIALADLSDGIVARKLSVDTNRRRILDSIIDRITIHTAAVTVVWIIPESIWLTGTVVLRDIIAIIFNWWLMRTKYVLMIPGITQRISTASYGVICATVLFTTGSIAVYISIAVNIFVWTMLLNHILAGLRVPIPPKPSSIARYMETGLRALCGHQPTLCAETRQQ